MRTCRPRSVIVPVCLAWLAGLSLVLLSGCDDVGPPAADLDTCPAGDEAWKARLDDAEAAGEDGIAGLAAELPGLIEACPESWQPSWLDGRRRALHARPNGAREPFERCFDLAGRAADDVGRARCGSDLAWELFLEGDYVTGEQRYLEAIAAAEYAERIDLASFARNNYAALLAESGRYAEVSDRLGEASRGLDQIGMDGAARAVAFNAAVIDFELGDIARAQRALEALRLEAEAAGARDTAEDVAILSGNIELLREDAVAAARWFDSVESESPDRRALIHLGRARAAVALGRLDEALPDFAQAVEDAGAINPVMEARAETYLAAAEFQAGRDAAARERLVAVMERADELGAVHAAWLSRWMLGADALDDGDVATARPLLEQAVDRLESMRGALVPGDALHFLRERIGAYVDLAIARSDSVGEAGGSAALIEVVAQAHANALRHTLGDDLPAPAQLQAALGPDEVLLAYLLGEKRGLLVAVRRDGLVAHAVPGRDALLPDLRGYRSALEEGASGKWIPSPVGERLTAALLQPVAGWIDSASRISIVADRELALLPFAALPFGSAPLGERVEVARVPLVAVGEDRALGRAPILLAGQPEFGTQDGYDELPWSGLELSRLGEIWGEGATTIAGGSFTREALESLDLSRFRTLHFATHAEASTRDPRKCGMVLSGGEWLGLDAVRELPLRDALIVLSACRTGLGELVPGEGVVGLAWAFLQAGASGVVVTHWPVDDAAAARLMVAFHRELRAGRPAASALTLARRERAAAGDAPRDWAPFEIILRPRPTR